ncbi:MAG: WHG domain-containing protein [Acidimicrobiia bacterium]|nr:WHG domain-containing protein [Acidimicrobiia bacterium]
MGKKVGLTLDNVIDVAATIADRDGLEAASLRAVADELGIKTPSLYNHVAGLAGLRRELALHAARQMSEVVAEAAGSDTPEEILRRTARSYRRFALDHPGLYSALLPAPKPGEDDDLYAAMAAPVTTLADTLVAAGVDEQQTTHLIRTLRAVVHGFIDLEMKDGFGMPEEVDVSFERSVDLVIEGVLSGAK